MNDDGNLVAAIGKAIQGVNDKTVTVRTGTVVSNRAPLENTQVVLDNDLSETAVTAMGTGAPYPIGTRVALLAYPPRGLLVIGGVTDDDTGWIVVQPAGTGDGRYQNSWVNWGTLFGEASYRRKNGFVYLKGVVKDGAPGLPIFTLPVGFRPPHRRIFSGVAFAHINTSGGQSAGTAHTHQITKNDMAVRLEVETSGVVYMFGSAATSEYFGLDSVAFAVD